MMKYTLGLVLLLICTFCKEQNKTNAHKDNFNYDIKDKDNFNYNVKDTVTSYGPNSMVRNIKQGRNGTILFAASGAGVFRYDGNSFTNLASKIGSRRYWDVLEDQRGNLWFATTYSGVYHYDGKFFRHFTTAEGLADNLIMSICEDKAGAIWIGTGGGVSRYDGKSFQNFTTKEGLPKNDITTITTDKTGNLWIVAGGEPCFYDGKTFTVLKNKDGKAFNNVRSIIDDKKGNIWVGGADGLWRYDGKTYTNFTPNFVGYIYEDKAGNIWTSSEETPNGTWAISRYDEKSLLSERPTVTLVKAKEQMLFGILEASDRSIWFGSFKGVYRYDGTTVMDFKK